MSKTEITPDLIGEYIRRGRRHDAYTETTGAYARLREHAIGICPEGLIERRRPSEDEQTKEYRRSIYVPKTKNPIGKVISSLGKIRRSSDWSISYDQGAVPPRVAEGERLEDYCERKYPYYQSLTNWVFSELLRTYLIDANALVAVCPLGLPTDSSEYVRPYARIFTSDRVLEYKPDDWALLMSDETVEYGTPKGYRTRVDGRVYYVITTETVQRYVQTTSAGDYALDYEYSHHFGYLPIVRVGGLFVGMRANAPIYESRLSGMLPELDEAAREYSDLQAEVVQHIYSERWQYASNECPTCKGVGLKPGTDEACPTCKGVGYVAMSPYQTMILTPPQLGQSVLPTPPAGYIQKQVEIVKIQDERVRAHLRDALAAVNMEFLADVPLSQSGVAKETDRDELNNFVNSIAEDIVAIMDMTYKFIADYRYSLIVPSADARAAMLPKVAVPERFDLLSSSVVLQELTALKAAGVSPVLIRAQEIEYARKKFCTSPEVAYEAQCVFDLDPLPGASADDKFTMLSNDGVTRLDYVLSCNIAQYVRRAAEADKDFYALSIEARRSIVLKMAEETLMSIDEDQRKQTEAKPLDFGGANIDEDDE